MWFADFQSHGIGISCYIFNPRTEAFRGRGVKVSTWLKLFQIKDTWWWSDEGTEGRNLDRMSMISFLFSLKQIGFMRKKSEGRCFFTYFFPLVDFGSSSLSDDTKAPPPLFFFPPSERQKMRFKGNRTILCSWLGWSGQGPYHLGPSRDRGTCSCHYSDKSFQNESKFTKYINWIMNF